jgi:hypothetical protein
MLIKMKKKKIQLGVIFYYGWTWQLIPVILTTQEAEIERIMI